MSNKLSNLKERPNNQSIESKFELNNKKPACKMKLPDRISINMRFAIVSMLLISNLVETTATIIRRHPGTSSSSLNEDHHSSGASSMNLATNSTTSNNWLQEAEPTIKRTPKMVTGVLGTRIEDDKAEKEAASEVEASAKAPHRPMINGADSHSELKPASSLPAQPEEDKGENLIDVDGDVNTNGATSEPATEPRLIHLPQTGAANTSGGQLDGNHGVFGLQTDGNRMEQLGGQKKTRRKRALDLGQSDRLQAGSGKMVNPDERIATAINSDNDNGAHIGKAMSTVDTWKLKCRVEKNLYLDFEEYKHYSCAICYNTIPKKLFWTKFVFKKEARIWLFDETSGQTVLPNETNVIGLTFKTESVAAKWRECCTKAIDCCKQNSIYLPNTTDHNGNLVDNEQANVCPATWDGLGCWPESPAGIVAQHPCPDNVYFMGFTPVCRGIVTKQCFANGSWFIRNDHEWSDYNNCAPLPLYATRMLIGSAWHIISAIVIGPALIILHKFPNRGGSKRVRILSNLLFWLLLNSIMAAIHKIGIIGGIFLPGTDYDDPPPPPVGQLPNMTANFTSGSTPSSIHHQQHAPYAQGNGQQPLSTTAIDPVIRRQARSTSLSSYRIHQVTAWSEKLDRARLHYGRLNAQFTTEPALDLNHTVYDGYNTPQENGKGRGTSRGPLGLSKKAGGRAVGSSLGRHGEDSLLMGKVDFGLDDYVAKSGLPDTNNNNSKAVNSGKQVTYVSDRASISSNRQEVRSRKSNRKQVGLSAPEDVVPHRTSVQDDKRPKLVMSTASTLRPPANSNTIFRFKRSPPDQGRGASQPAPVVFVCWLLSLGLRITRLLGYAWMFTGAVYLCSILHFAPAEPPAAFIKWLMIFTDGFPLTMGLVYLIARTIYEPSPLTLIVKLPYYYLIDDFIRIDELWATQLNCWMFRSKYSIIEEIADFPNFCLVILNVGLFVFTLIIMCRISRPGCTRQEMSLGDYFKAAGTLVVLYGGHYALFAYKPPEQGCLQGQVLYYAFLFVDGIQGVAVSYVFCYRTAEGKEIMCKWLSSCLNRGPKWCRLSSGSKHHTILEHGTNIENNKSSAHSTRSNNSGCNGKDVTTELIDIDENPFGNQF